MSGPQGCWVAYFADNSEIRVFRSEIAALRSALPMSMKVVYCHWGESPAEAEERVRQEAS
jgi:hypothetical protein